MIDFDSTTMNHLFMDGLINQTQNIDYAHDYSRIRLSRRGIQICGILAQDMHLP